MFFTAIMGLVAPRKPKPIFHSHCIPFSLLHAHKLSKANGFMMAYSIIYLSEVWAFSIKQREMAFPKSKGPLAKYTGQSTTE